MGLMPNRRKAMIWLVDDREQNRQIFIERHGSEFDIKTFETPDQILSAISEQDPPDALLCDIFYYGDPVQRERVEARITNEAKRIEDLAAELHADQAADGIGLIQRVRQRFHNDPPFPIYAYTSKGPYLLHSQGFDELEELDARWLFKNKHSPQVERNRITKDIADFQERHDWTPKRIWAVAWRTGIITAFLGALLSVLFDRIARCFGF
jgi:CheY-like chemotaxis protein